MEEERQRENVCVRAFVRVNMLNKEEDREIHCARDRPAVLDESGAEREMKGRRECVGRVGMDGWREVGCCVTW